MRPFVVIWIFLLTPYLSVNAQTDIPLTPEHEVNISFQDFVTQVEAKTHLRFFYLEEWVANFTINENFKGIPINECLQKLLEGTGMTFFIYYDTYVTLVKDPSEEIAKQQIINERQQQRKLEQIVFGDSLNYEIGKNQVLKGYVYDIESGEPLIGATIAVEGTDKFAVTDRNGFYSITLRSGEYVVTYNYVNLEAASKLIKLYDYGQLNIELEPRPIQLDEIVISAEADDQNVNRAVMGKSSIDISTINKMPAFLGEVDALKSIQFLPGVTSVGEGSAGFNVRGGSADQNLILLDGAVIYNPNHLFGFFSAFHPDALKNVTFYRGGLPAQYGGRISSVLDVSQKSGNFRKLEGHGGLGLISSRLLFEGPIVKDKLSFLVAGRSSYSDWLLGMMKDNNIRNSSANFYDGTAKISYKINEKNNLFVTGYLSHDDFSFANDTTYAWNNKALSFAYNHLFSNSLVWNNSIMYSSYDYTIEDKESVNAFTINYGIENYKWKSDFGFIFSNSKIDFGFDIDYYTVKPGVLKNTSEISNVSEVNLATEQAAEGSLYISNEYKLNEHLLIMAGLRYSMFANRGPAEILNYQENSPRNTNSVRSDTTFYGSSEWFGRRSGWQPRISLRYLLSGNSSLKIGYARTYQFIHLISNTSTITPVDVWKLTDTYIPPQRGDQFSIGAFKNIKDNKYEASAEVYYKSIIDIPEYKDGAELLLNDHLEQELTTAEGRAYGVELSFKKNTGRLTGWMNYSLSRTERKTNAQYREEIINNNNYFPSNFDRPHNITLATEYEISKRYILSGSFIYASGRPITAPVSKFEIDGVTIINFSERNKYRVPDYHRLDIALTMKTNHRKNKKWEGSWTLSVYNIYARKNAYSVFFDDDGASRAKAYRLAILGVPFPSLTYNFKF